MKRNLATAVKGAAIPSLLALARMVLARPRLKQLARRALVASPRLHARLHGLMFSAARAQAPARRPAGSAELSPRARQLYSQLTKARKART